MNRVFIIASLLMVVMISTAADSTYYFVKWESASPEGPELEGGQSSKIEQILEIYSDSTQTAPPGWEAKTKAQINELGYYTPSESYDKADAGDIDEGTTDDGGYASWFSVETKNNIKYVYGGSKTTRPILPGYNYLLARNARTAGGGTWLRLLYAPDSTFVRKWGWRHSWVCCRQYASTSTYTWRQDGWHKWASQGTVKHSYKIKQY